MSEATDKLTPDDAKGSVSFSIRLTEKQRDLLARAGEIRGWTITSLLKNAALEKAAHIVNTTTPNRVDFREAARLLAEQVFAPRRAWVPHPDSNGMDLAVVEAAVFQHFDPESLMECEFPVQVSPWQMSQEFLNQLREATRFGGTEFLNLFLDSAEVITIRRNTQSLPAPVDPNTV